MKLIEYRAVARDRDGNPLTRWERVTWETFKPSVKLARAWAHRALLDEHVASVAINESVLPGRGQEWQDGPVIEIVDTTTASAWTWVRPHWDKPWRCPDCHRGAERAWAGTGYGPRTKFRCHYGCRVQWRVGTRAERLSREWRTLHHVS